ncbi:meprin A subunit beta-like [Oncorhynchus kisutch]|uniref:meprin A subunit beta-like n=1 Tax=Oncorhynchus kisutch TaxID=8019 RepID=UPI0012DBE4DF|nr:meprin A subunit beta-like [Oncorhynchus kisutch]
MNTKGIILRAFDQFRLKTCMDFQPRDSEMYYLTIEKRTGCSSYVGRTFPNGQVVSIGQNCDIIAIVEHELLHALGFWHEQSRYDRDEYVTIVNENIVEASAVTFLETCSFEDNQECGMTLCASISASWERVGSVQEGPTSDHTKLSPLRGHERNFVKVSPHDSTTLGFPYDYSSVLHYSETSFSKGEGPTIITKQPEYQKIIGQRLEMSPQDALMLNKLYGCKKSISFMEHCNFDNQRLCGMSRCTKSLVGGWKRMKTVIGGPYSDFTNLGKTDGTGFFMHASTASGQEGDTARLESREMTPSRKCSVQCLQFYYYHSGNESDQLNIWMRVYRDERNPNGTLRHMGQITGSPGSHWMPYHVPLNATKTFQVEFEVRKGAGQSTGGFSIDDINLSETECPHHTWQIKDFENLLTTSDINTVVYSPRYYSPEGYAYQIAIYLREMFFGVYVRLVSGKYDDQLQWPCHQRQVTIQLLDQNPHTQQRMSKQISITTEPSLQDDYDSWNNPRIVGMLKNRGDESFYVNPAVGYLKFLTLTQLKHREFLKGGNIFFLITMQGMILIMIVLS